MLAPARTLKSDYMRYAKLETGARYNLATSGVADCALSDLEVSLDDLALHGPNAYGYGPLTERIAARFGVPEDCVVIPGGGCSFANHLAMAAILEPGSEVLIEEPTYELLLATLGALSAKPRRFLRRPEDRWRLDAGDVAARIDGRTRLVVLTNLHNPTGSLASRADIAKIGRDADRFGAWVLVDEVYLELAYPDGQAPSAFDPDGRVVVTSSLTKAYGLSGLRCGWILAPAALAQKMRRLNDLFGVLPPHIAERLAVVAFDQLPRLRARADALINANRAAYQELLGAHPALDQVVFDHGTTVFPRLIGGDGDTLNRRLNRDFETCIGPGRFFGRPDYMRIGLAGDPAMTREGLTRVAEALSLATA
jgi:aspartate/methionine/tyrosine aminotransferase